MDKITEELHVCGECGCKSDWPLYHVWNGLYVCDTCNRKHANQRYEQWLRSDGKQRGPAHPGRED